MVSVSNGGPDEVSTKSPLVNGCIPKYKPRRVSAVRDFPPLCGRKSVLVNLTPEEIGGSETGPMLVTTTDPSEMVQIIDPQAQAVGNCEANIKTSSSGADTVEEPQLRKDSEVQKDTDMENDIGCSATKNSNIEELCESRETFNVTLDVDMTESVDDLTGRITEIANLNENSLMLQPGFQLPNDVEYHGNEAENNVIEVERLESMDVTTTTTKENEGFMHAAEKSKTCDKLNEVNTLDVIEIDCPNRGTGAKDQTMLIELNKVENVSFANKPGVEEAVYRADAYARLKDKYRKRSVSAIRDFPPHCGQKKCLNENQDTGIEKESTAPNDGGAGGKSNRVLQQNNIQETEMEDADDKLGGKDAVHPSGRRDDKIKPKHSASSSEDDDDMNIVYALKAEPNSPLNEAKTSLINNRDRKNKKVISHDQRTSGEKSKKLHPPFQHKSKAVAKKTIQNVKSSIPAHPKKLINARISNDDDDHGDGGPADGVGKKRHLPKKTRKRQQDFVINLPSFGPNSSGHGDARIKVRDTLRLFNAICRKLLQKEEANSTAEDEGKPGRSVKRIDLFAAKTIKEKGKEVNTSKQILGDVPGVQVGDEFQYRVELAVVGIHRLYQAGIDSVKLDNGLLVATSIVAAGVYSDDLENADVLIYSGQGGNVVGKKKQQPEDQKLERGNLALKNSIDAKTPVRVVRGWKDKAVDPLEPKPKMVMTYVYDGLYTVQRYWMEPGAHGKQVFMFEMRRNPGQPELAWKQLKKPNKARHRPGVCIMDVSGGKEPFGIAAVNTVNDEKPPPFNYTARMVYPSWHKPVPPLGCDCVGRCLDSRRCRCAVRNGGEIPYNRNGALVETKLLVYECGPHCKCPPSCYNRVSQRGIRHQLEIFRTESRGWGLRALTSVASGSFICEYAGELLEDTEAERRIGNDEYLFDIGQNLSGSSLNPEDQALSAELVEDGGYTIDACQYGNVGRFINHSCSPNIYAQNVIYDHDDKKMPHIMLFAMENIPPLQELTYHYNYSVDQIRDSHGNIKVKNCYCGAPGCTGRMY